MRKICKILFLAMVVMIFTFLSIANSSFAATEKVDVSDFSDYQLVEDGTSRPGARSTGSDNDNNNSNTDNTTDKNTNKNNANTNKNNNNNANNNSNTNKNTNKNASSNIANTATTSHPQTGIYNTTVCVVMATVVISIIVISYIKLKKYNY